MLFIGKNQKDDQKLISDATYPLKESRRESLLGCAGCVSFYVWIVISL